MIHKSTMFSFRKRFATLGNTIQTYPITTTILCAICVISLVLTWQSRLSLTSDQLELLGKVLSIFLVYVFASASVTKRFIEESKKHMLWQAVLLIGMVAYFFMLPTNFDNPPTTFFIRHALIQVAAVASLLVLTLWTNKRNEQSMYHGMIQIVMHAVLAVLFSLVLACGISGALWGIEGLFSVNIVSEWYATIFAVIGILLGGLSFLDGIRNRVIDEDEAVQPAKWKTLLGWVVGILLLVYGVILYIYLGKIIVTGERPSNVVTPLSFAFSGFVVLGSILLVPLLTDEDHTVLRKKVLVGMYVSLIPILIMVFFAIKLRIGEYGLTEMRYIICALLLRLLISSGYIIINKQKDLRCVAALFTGITIFSFLAGPLSASGLSKIYQSKSLDAFVSQYDVRDGAGMLDSSKLLLLTNDEEQKVADLIRYLVDYHGVETIQSYYAGEGKYSYTVLETLGLPLYPTWDASENSYVYLSVEEPSGEIDITGYKTLYKDISLYTSGGDSQVSSMGSGATVRMQGSDLLLGINATEYTINLNELIPEFRENTGGDSGYNTIVSRDQFVFDGSGFKLLFSYINGKTQDDNTFALEGIGFDLLIE